MWLFRESLEKCTIYFQSFKLHLSLLVFWLSDHFDRNCKLWVQYMCSKTSNIFNSGLLFVIYITHCIYCLAHFLYICDFNVAKNVTKQINQTLTVWLTHLKVKNMFI